MKQRNQKMEILRQRLQLYCKQIGIVDCEIPHMYFYGEEFSNESNAATQRHGLRESRRGGRYTTYFGLCAVYSRTIFVNMRGRRTLRELNHTLVHELVHYRFRYMSHGVKFERRIKDIIADKEYPRKQITIPAVPYI